MADVTLPQLGETVTEGTITQWFKAVGDEVAEDEPLFEVSTDKVDTEVPSPVSGTLTEIRAQEGDTVEVGTVIAVVGDGAAVASAAEAPAGAHRLESMPAAASAPAPAPLAAPAPAPAPVRGASDAMAQAGDNRLLSPVVRRLVNEHGIDPDAITGSGPGGRITRDDVLNHIDVIGVTPQPAPVVDAPPAIVPAPAPAPAPANFGLDALYGGATAQTGAGGFDLLGSGGTGMVGGHAMMSKGPDPSDSPKPGQSGGAMNGGTPKSANKKKDPFADLLG